MIRAKLAALWHAFWSALRGAAAPELDVAPDAGGGRWLLRAFFRPPRPGRRDYPEMFFTYMGREAATRLDMDRDRSLGAWLRHLFLRPLGKRRRFAADLRKLRGRPHRPRIGAYAFIGRVLKPLYVQAGRARASIDARLPGG